jgi:hypothetical protein
MEKANGVEVKLTGLNGNVFMIIGTVSKALKRAGFSELVKKYEENALKCNNYDEVLQLTMSVVDVN